MSPKRPSEEVDTEKLFLIAGRLSGAAMALDNVAFPIDRSKLAELLRESAIELAACHQDDGASV